MNRITDIIICLGKSGRPFCGHNEKSESCNSFVVISFVY
jgi:hypothetical protein